MYDIENFYERTIALLAAQFQESLPDGSRTNFQKMLAAIVSEFYSINDAELELYSNRWLSNAEGVQLDGLGEILGLERIPGQSDADYRQALYFQIFINRSTGTPEDIIATLKFLTNANIIQYFEIYPAFFQLRTDGDPSTWTATPQQIIDTIHSVSPASVQYAPVTAHYDSGPPFVFASDPIVEDFYVAPNPFDFEEIHPFHVSSDGILDQQLQVNRGQVEQTEGRGFAEDNFAMPDAGHLAEVLSNNGNIPPAP